MKHLKKYLVLAAALLSFASMEAQAEDHVSAEIWGSVDNVDWEGNPTFLFDIIGLAEARIANMELATVSIWPSADWTITYGTYWIGPDVFACVTADPAAPGFNQKVRLYEAYQTTPVYSWNAVAGQPEENFTPTYYWGLVYFLWSQLLL